MSVKENVKKSTGVRIHISLSITLSPVNKHRSRSD